MGDGMSKCKPPTVADLAAGAAHGRRVVMSAGSMDGAFLAALAKVGLAGADGAVTSTWADGVASHNGQVSVGNGTANPSSDMPKGGQTDGKNDLD